MPDASPSRKLVSQIRFCTIPVAALAKQTVMSRRPDRAFPNATGGDPGSFAADDRASVG